VLTGVCVRQSRLATVIGLNLATALFFLGGGFTTVAFLPGWLQAIARLLPTSYANDGLRQTLLYSDMRGVAGDRAALSRNARAALATDARPIDDIRSTARYRATVAANLLEEFLAQLAQ